MIKNRHLCKADVGFFVVLFRGVILETIKGYVERIVFRNENNGYTVLDVECDGDYNMCVGQMDSVSVGELLLIKGEEVVNPVYGPQIKIEEYKVLPPEDVKSIERYLASGAVKGIGAAMASRIIRRFGKETFNIIECEPERLAEVKGISEKKAREIATQIAQKRDLREVMMQLQKIGISYQLALKLYTQYGLKITGIIQENPYRLAEEVHGIGFLKADEIAKQVGIVGNSDYRVRSGIFYVLQKACADGHMYLPRDIMIEQSCDLLGVDGDTVNHMLMDLCIDKKVYIKEISEEIRVYVAQNYFMEMNVARKLKDLNVTYDVDEEDVSKKLSIIEKGEDIILDELQRQAVIEAVRKGLLIITGGPGTGKTTTIRTIINYFESEGLDIFLTAPTGRAAKRMTETTGYEAQTLHRLLELSGGFDDDRRDTEFGRNEQNPLEVDVIIVDETSMVDMFLLNSLLKAVMVGTKLIFVGDVSQLPSVGPGCVLKDMIDSETLPVVRLNKIFRQAMESDIVKNAHRINNGQPIDLYKKDSKDFFFIHQNEPIVMQRAILSLVQQKLPNYVNCTYLDIQVITPMRKGMFGVHELNSLLQKYLNPQDKDKCEKEVFDHLFREGDKVMQIKNNYQLEWEVVNKYNITVDKGMGIFNGDIGIIEKIDETLERMIVVFDESRRVEYPYKNLDELELAYAITVHKSQGSEYPAVVMPMFFGPRPLMNRNLLYTAVTRARNCVAMVGLETAFNEMMSNESENKRYSGLKDFLK